MVAALKGLQLLPAVLVLLAAAAAAVTAQVRPQVAVDGCQSRCGQVEVPYPFGLGNDTRCYKEGFQLTCNDTAYDPPRLFFGDFDILEIDLPQGQVRSLIYMARNCYNSTGSPLNTGTMSADLRDTLFTFSAQRDRFFVIGCDSLVLMNDPNVLNFATGCVSYCTDLSSVDNGTCSGIGCCQAEIPKDVKYFRAIFSSFFNHTNVHKFNPCSYAFLADREEFTFNTSILAADYTYQQVKMPTVLEFSLQEKQTCESATRDRSTYACRSPNSDCLPSMNGLGYICNCSSGYSGNPYLPDGCRDIDECADPKKYPCDGICANIPGNYNCTCRPGYHSSNAKTVKCVLDPFTTRVNEGLPLSAKWALGSVLSVAFLLVIIFGSYWGYKKMKMIHLRQKFFEQNGGIFLKRQMTSHRATAFSIFTIAQLEKATDNFSRESLLGEGGNGSVYKGTLRDGRVVAIKKDKKAEAATAVLAEKINLGRRKEFASEVLILAGINHKHVVRLLGCCLEVDIPMLVYEYIANKTLSDYIHHRNIQSPITFSDCLRLATETAKALAYLHDEIEPAIIHGDIKPSNILLDERYNVKVADFGTSIYVEKCEIDETGTSAVKGTLGYLDPEYMMMGQITDKSDVYSFGVVLMELLTRRKDVGNVRGDFISFVDSERLMRVLHPCYLNQGNLTAELVGVSKLAVRCMKGGGEDRPTMAEVAIALETFRRSIAPAAASSQPPQGPVIDVEAFNVPTTSTGFFSIDSEEVPILRTKYSGRGR